MVDCASALRQRGHSVHLFTNYHDPHHCYDETRDGRPHAHRAIAQRSPVEWLERHSRLPGSDSRSRASAQSCAHSFAVAVSATNLLLMLARPRRQPARLGLLILAAQGQIKAPVQSLRGGAAIGQGSPATLQSIGRSSKGRFASQLQHSMPGQRDRIGADPWSWRHRQSVVRVRRVGHPFAQGWAFGGWRYKPRG